jgi:hypothetical protein
VGYFEYVRMRRRAVTRSYDARTRRLGRCVPGLSLELAAAQTEEQIWAKLCAFAVDAECVVVSFLVSSGAVERRWPANMTLREPEGLVRARYALSGDGHLEFGFPSDGDMASESDVLLQLVADAIELRLRHCDQREENAPRVSAASASEAIVAGMPADAGPPPDVRELGGGDGLLSSGARRLLASR